MKLKKRFVFLLFYYAFFTIALTIISCLLKDHLQFNGWSAFPITYIILSILWILYTETDACEERLKWDSFYRARKHQKITVSEFEEEWESRKDPETDKLETGVFHFGTLLAISLFIPFILFGNYWYKIFCFFAVFFIGFIPIGIWLFFFSPSHKKFKAEKQQRKRELEEQKKREELGKWK